MLVKQTAQPPVRLGPSGNQWAYDRESRTFDLSPDVKSGVSMKTLTHPNASIRIAPEESALVVVDMQNFFVHPKMHKNAPAMEIVDNIKEVVAKCRELGIKVIWLNWGLQEEDIDQLPPAHALEFSRGLLDLYDNDQRHGAGCDLGDGMGRLMMAGEWNTAVYAPLFECADREKDIMCNKKHFSGFWPPTSELSKHLEGSGTRTLLFAGVNADCCVHHTATDAGYRGWGAVLLQDCVATADKQRLGWSIDSASYYGFSVTNKAFLDAKESNPVS